MPKMAAAVGVIAAAVAVAARGAHGAAADCYSAEGIPGFVPEAYQLEWVAGHTLESCAAMCDDLPSCTVGRARPPRAGDERAWRGVRGGDDRAWRGVGDDPVMVVEGG